MSLPIATGFGIGVTTMGYTLFNADGTIYAARTTAGVTEPSPGKYHAVDNVPEADKPVSIEWDDGNGNVSELVCVSLDIERADGPLDKTFKDGDNINVNVSGTNRAGIHTKV